MDNILNIVEEYSCELINYRVKTAMSWLEFWVHHKDTIEALPNHTEIGRRLLIVNLKRYFYGV